MAKAKTPPKQEFTQDFCGGMTLAELGNKYGFSRTTAANWATKWGLERDDKEPWLADFAHDFEVKGMPVAELNQKYGITRGQANSRIKKHGLVSAKNTNMEGFKWCNFGRHQVALSEYGTGSYCNECLKAYRKNLSESKIDWALEQLDMKYECSNCGYNKSRAAIDFHHSGEKDKSIGELRNSSKEAILEEMKKCIPLCRNCHRIEHKYDLAYREKVWSLLDQAPSCTRCGLADKRVLEFDHLSHSNKHKSVFTMATEAYTEEELRVEISKCRILCGNCHREKTYPKADVFESIDVAKLAGSKRLLNAEKLSVEEDYHAGFSTAKLAEKYGVSKTTISNWSKAWGTPKWVHPMLDDHYEGVDGLMEKYGVTRSQISYWVKKFEMGELEDEVL